MMLNPSGVKLINYCNPDTQHCVRHTDKYILVNEKSSWSFVTLAMAKDINGPFFIDTGLRPYASSRATRLSE